MKTVARHNRNIEAGINGISAVNGSTHWKFKWDCQEITGIEVKENSDRIIALADEVVNIDLTADNWYD